MTIKAIIFDVDGVLIDSFEANLKFFQNLMIKFGYNSPTREEFPKYFALTMKDAIRALTKSTSEEEIIKVWEAGKNRDALYPMDLVSMPDGAPQIVKKLSKKYQLGIVSSRIKSSVFTVPELANIEKYFSALVSFEDTTKHKPNPEPLLLMAAILKIKPAEAIYIGDAQSDIEAARAAGMKIIIFGNKPFNEADANTSDFTKIPSIIKSL